MDLLIAHLSKHLHVGSQWVESIGDRGHEQYARMIAIPKNLCCAGADKLPVVLAHPSPFAGWLSNSTPVRDFDRADVFDGFGFSFP